ncbi:MULTISPECIES: ABC transporter permease [unclassified Brevibacterium]|uniref:ABC transporter permease n=1 Tax=unclassified Brevibacterium TaxID=2614124 RepID=UPI0010F96A69|nr:MULTISPECIES: ABC transporter permease [unclassified Brevibacterium]MCM1011246.1 ABC transporter permease [Brevibacterium sp. XM4083]
MNGAAQNSLATTLSRPHQDDLGAARVTALGLLLSEWTKLRSVRSLVYTVLTAFVATTAMTAYLIIDGTKFSSGEAGDIPFAFTSVYPLGMIVLIIAGVLAITSEYSSGSIGMSLIAVPRRTGMFMAKAAVLAAVTAVLAMVMSLLLYVIVQITGTVPSADGMSLFDPRMFWGVLGATAALPFGAVFGLALGGLTRNAAAAICLYFGVFQLGPQLLPSLVPDNVAGLADFMPLAAINVIRSGGLIADPYGSGTAAIVLLGWLVVLGGAAWLLLKRRDV